MPHARRGATGRGVAETSDQALARVAARQHGYVTRQQLLELGMGAGAIQHRVGAGRLVRAHFGVYAVGHLPTAPIARAGGAVLACGPGAALSHGSAGALWGLVKHWELPFEVTARSDRRRRGIDVHRSTGLRRQDVTVQLGIRVTSPARTVLDLAPRLSDKALIRAVNDLRVAGFLHLSALSELLDRCPRHPGMKRLRSFIEQPIGPTRSRFEDEFVAFAERFGLPRPDINVFVGRHLVDALFAEQRVIVELDGYEFHRGRDSFERDRDRDADTLAAGLQTVRVTWKRLRYAPRKEATRLAAILNRR